MSKRARHAAPKRPAGGRARLGRLGDVSLSPWGWAALVVAVAVLGTAAYGAYLYESTEGDIQDKSLGREEVEPGQEGEPYNVLLVGSDSRAGLTAEERVDFGAGTEDASGVITGQRADTTIIAHIDPATARVTMVQFPRDLFVPIAGRDKNRINSALEGKYGQRTLVRTVEQLTGLDINHYAQVNIAGFRDVVDAIDGIDLCLTEPVPFDSATGIEVTADELPLVHFDGEKALRFVRSRKVVEGGDLGRIQNQQKLLAAALDKVTSASTLLNPARIRNVLDAARGNISVDLNTGLLTLRNIANQLRSFDPERYEAYTVPNLGPATLPDGRSVVLPDNDAMKVLFDAIEANESPADADGVPDIAPSEIAVAVLNGTNVAGAESSAAEELESATELESGSVEVVRTATASRTNAGPTVVRYRRTDDDGKAHVVAAAVPGARVEQGSVPEGADVVVVVGTDFATTPLIQLTPIPIPEPSEQPEGCR